MEDQAEPIVAFYLFHRNAGHPDCPPAKSSALIKATSGGGTLQNDAESRQWKVTFDRSCIPQAPVRLAVFGSDPRCTVILSGPSISPIHCIIYAQLNSGHKMMIVEDRSESGTSFYDDMSAREGVQNRIRHDRLFAEGLSLINIGPYQFFIEYPLQEAEKMVLSRWFFEHEPEPISEPMLKTQLMGRLPDFQELGQIGEGGNAQVYRFVEKRSGLLLCVKKQAEHLNSNAEKESIWMKHLQSPLLAQYLHSKLVKVGPTKEWWTYMPLYRGNLTDMLPQPLAVLNPVMLQMLEAVSYVHGRGALHQDIKPDNFFLVKKRPIQVVLGDFGHTVSLRDHTLLTGDCGTDGFSAPERFSQRHTTALDVYSLGVTFFQMIEHERLKHLDWKMCMEKLVDYPFCAYRGLIMRMTAQKPEERPTIRQCIEVVKAKDYAWGKPDLPPRLLECSISCPQTQRISPQKISASPKANLSRKRVEQPSMGTVRNDTLDTHNANRRIATPETVLKTAKSQDKVSAHPVKNSGIAPPVSVFQGQKHEEKVSTHHNIFAHLETTRKTTPTAPAVKVAQFRGNNINQYRIRHPIPTNPRYGPPLQAPTPLRAPTERVRYSDRIPHLPRPPTQHSHQPDRIVQPRPPRIHRIGPRNYLRRGAVRKANIDRAFTIHQRLGGIYERTTKGLWTIGEMVVNNTRDLAYVGVQLYNIFKDANDARYVINYVKPEARIKMLEAARLAAGLNSKKLRFVTPAEYEEERTKSKQLREETKLVEKSATVKEEIPAAAAGKAVTAR